MFSAWNRYWFGPSAYVDLAIFRCAAIGLQLILILYGSSLRGDPFAHLEDLTSYPEETWAPLMLMRTPFPKSADLKGGREDIPIGTRPFFFSAGITRSGCTLSL